MECHVLNSHNIEHCEQITDTLNQKRMFYQVVYSFCFVVINFNAIGVTLNVRHTYRHRPTHIVDTYNNAIIAIWLPT